MLSFLLDGLHEDLNKIKTKPYVSELDIAGMSDIQGAEAYWNAHTTRNQSIIVDSMHGQYRSEVECPKCNNVSLTFDAFLMLTLQIPTKEQIMLDIHYIPYTSDNSPILVKILVNRNYTLFDIKQELLEVLEKDIKLELGQVFNNQILEKLGIIDKLENSRSVFAYEMPEISSDETIVILEFSKINTVYSYQQIDPAGFPRILKISKSADSEQLHRLIYSYFL